MTASLRKIGLTPKKGALVAVLAVSLCAVWGPQLAGMLGSDSPATGAGRRGPVAATPARPVAGRSAGKPSSPQAADRQPTSPLAMIALSEAVSHDPFAAPAWSPEARRSEARSPGLAEAETDTELEERFGALRSSGVAMILVSDSGRAVQIGDKTLQVGDQHEGFEIVEITASGVVFQPAPANGGDDRGA